MSDTEPFKYWAFISYSHRDQRWAAWLIRRLEAYRLPRDLVGREVRDGPLPSRLFPIFRDRDELSSSPELGGEIQRALRASRYLVVICSPDSARSRWVDEEIRYFKSLGREERVLSFIVGGSPGSGGADECFAPALRFGIGADGRSLDRPVEPIAADARPQGDGRDRARLKLIAGLLGVGYDELRRRDLIARNRRLGFIAASTTVIAALTVALAIAAYVARQAAERHRQQAEDLIGFMLGDLRGRLDPVGRLDVLDAVGEKAMSYFAAAEQDGQTDATLSARAQALRQIGEIRAKQGRLAEAGPAFAAALDIDRQLVRHRPDSTPAIFNLGQSEFWAGYAAWLSGDFATARTHFLAYRAASQRLLELEPDDARWLQELAYGETNLGLLADTEGKTATALPHLETAREIARDLLKRSPADQERQLGYADVLSWIASVLEKLGRIPEADRLLREQAGVVRTLIQHDPRDMQLKYRYTLPLMFTAQLQAKSGHWHDYDALADESTQLIRELVKYDPGNVEWRDTLARAHEIKAVGHEFREQWPAALNEARRAFEIATQCHNTDPDQSSWRQLYVRTANRLAELQLNTGEPHSAQAVLDTVSAAASALAAEDQALEVSVDHQLLRLELARKAGKPLATAVPGALPTAITRLRGQSAAAAVSAQLRLDVIRGTVSPRPESLSVLPHCGLEHRRLLRFLRRNGVASEPAACPMIAASLSEPEQH